MTTRDASYFVERNRGEVAQLQALLKAVLNEKDIGKRREVIKRVVAFMTMGIDVSRLFTDMVMATNTRDIVQKKMIYLYLCNYAESKADLALLAINTLQKDCRDENPMVRALALRSICSLRLPNILEYIVEVVRKGLSDPSGYVRKTAVLGVAKLHQLSPLSHAKGAESELLVSLRAMIRDRDAQVVANCVCALEEIMAPEGGLILEANEVAVLLAKMKEFNEWNQAVVLEVLSKYRPANEDDIFEIMNLLDDKFKHNNSAVVLAVTNLFLKITMNIPEVHQSVYQRIRDPLITIMTTSSSPEVMFSCLHHISLIVSRSEGQFQDDYKSFFIQYSDPSHIKILKLDILTNISTEQNFLQIVSELGEYVTDVDIQTARQSIQSIGKIALKHPNAADEIITRLFSFFALDIDYVTTETLIVMKDLFRKYPKSSMSIINDVKSCLGRVTDPEGKSAIIWMVAEFGDLIPESPYLLESLTDKFLEEESSIVQLQLLSSVMKLFFKRPPECQAMLGKILREAIQSATHHDVHDRALFYYRLLSTDIQKAEQIVNSSTEIVSSFAEEDTFEFRDRLFEEFNTLSVIYRLPHDRFIIPVNSKQDQTEEDDDGEDEDADATEEDEEEEFQEESHPFHPRVGDHPHGHQASSTEQSIFEGLSHVQGKKEPEFQLVPNPSIDPQTFQKKWGSLPAGTVIEVQLNSSPTACKEVEGVFKSDHIYCMASGIVGDTMKLFLYGQESKGAFMFTEFVIKMSLRKVTATIKVDQPDTRDHFVQYIEAVASKI